MNAFGEIRSDTTDEIAVMIINRYRDVVGKVYEHPKT